MEDIKLSHMRTIRQAILEIKHVYPDTEISQHDLQRMAEKGDIPSSKIGNTLLVGMADVYHHLDNCEHDWLRQNEIE